METARATLGAEGNVGYTHVLVITARGVFLICGDVKLRARLDWDVLVADGETAPNLWTFLLRSLVNQIPSTRPRSGQVGHTVSNAMASGRPDSVLSASLELSTTDWWY